MDEYEKRQKAKDDRSKYRDAARRQFKRARRLNVKVGPFANVSPCEGGAFVEASVWVPAEEIEPKQTPIPDPPQEKPDA